MQAFVFNLCKHEVIKFTDVFLLLLLINKLENSLDLVVALMEVIQLTAERNFKQTDRILRIDLFVLLLNKQLS